MSNDIKKYVFVSLGIHIVAMFLFWFSPPVKIADEKDYKVTWIRLSRGDGGLSPIASFKKSKTLPQSTLREQKKAIRELSKGKEGTDLLTKETQTKQTVVQKYSQKRTSETGGINLDKTKTTPKTTQIDDALARIDQQLKQREVDLSVAQAKDGETGQSPFGSDKGSNTSSELVAYYNTIKRKITREWMISKGDVSGDLVTQIIVMIDANGNILRSQFKLTSGDGSFDESAMRAIRHTAPFPIPPQGIRNEALTEGFLIEFNPQTVTGKL